MAFKERSAKQKAAWKKLSPFVKRMIRKNPLSVWSKRIKREYNYQCAKCSKKTKLEAHHIYFKHLFPEQKEDLDNGLLLCLKCHDLIHSLYIENKDNYFLLIQELIKFRKPLKSIAKKRRNPSGIKYSYLC